MTIVTKVDFGWKPSEDFTGCVQFPSSERYWYVNGKLHREDGPAYEFSADNKNFDSWYLNGVKYTQQEHERIVRRIHNAESKKPRVSNDYPIGYILVVEDRDVDNAINNVMYEFDSSRTTALATVLRQYRDNKELEFVSHTPYGWVFRKV